MCYWVGTKKVREEIKRRYAKGTIDEIEQLFYNEFIQTELNDFKSYFVAIGKSKPELTVLLKENGKLNFRNMQWTLHYSYQHFKTGEKIERELLNSTCERVFTQHKDLIFIQRCLIPIDGYYEYYHFKGETYPYFIYPTDNGYFYAGGIWKIFNNPENSSTVYSFSIITTPANSLTKKIHNNPNSPNGSRMLLLLDPNQALQYMNENLKKNEIENFLHPYDEHKMKAHPVMRFQRKEFLQFFSTSKIQDYYFYPELTNEMNNIISIND